MQETNTPDVDAAETPDPNDTHNETITTDIAVVGAGAAGLIAAIAARGALRSDGHPVVPSDDAPSVVLIDSMNPPGKKILISGGGRCNITNETVTEHDFAPMGSKIVRAVLKEFPPTAILHLIHTAGVPTRVEDTGKIFPDGDARARDVLAALLDTAAGAGVTFRFGVEAQAVTAHIDGGFTIATKSDAGQINVRAQRVVLATGGKSIPQTGSTGSGYGWAETFGHSIVAPRPALVGLTVKRAPGLSGLTLPAIVSVEEPSGKLRARLAGSLLFTHRGISGPAGLDASLYRAAAGDPPPEVFADFWRLADVDGPWKQFHEAPKPPGACLAEAPSPASAREVEDFLLRQAKHHPKRTLAAALAVRLPRRLIDAVVSNGETTLAELRSDVRRAAALAVTHYGFKISGDEGFAKAEVTAGGIPLAEMNRRTLESRNTDGLHFCGEIVDVTGRLGGFNFQWAWSSGFVAGRGALNNRAKQRADDAA